MRLFEQVSDDTCAKTHQGARSECLDVHGWLLAMNGIWHIYVDTAQILGIYIMQSAT
jgi:hypothetical protein